MSDTMHKWFVNMALTICIAGCMAADMFPGHRVGILSVMALLVGVSVASEFKRRCAALDAKETAQSRSKQNRIRA